MTRSSSHPYGRWLPVPLTAFALFGVLCGLALLITSYLAPSDLSAYRRARPCAGSPEAGCLLTEPATVLAVRQRYQRAGNLYAYLLDLPEGRSQVRVQAFAIWLPRFQAGQTVTATIWRGRLVHLQTGGESWETQDSPAGQQADWAHAALVAVVAGPLPLLLFWADRVRHRLRRTRRSREAHIVNANWRKRRTGL